MTALLHLTSSIKPVIALTAEVPQRDSTTVVRLDSDDQPDYYDDDDFIPCFYPGQEGSDYFEALVGFDDFYDHSTNQVEPDKRMIVISSEIEANPESSWLYPNDDISVDPQNYMGNNSPNLPPNCEPASSLTLENFQVEKRYQRFGKSRIRWIPSVQHHLDPKNHLYDSDRKINIANLRPNEIPNNNFIQRAVTLKGYEFITQTPKSTNPILDQSPEGFTFWCKTYEHDWYAVPKTHLGPSNILGREIEVIGRHKYRWEHYNLFYVEYFNWCFPSTINFDRSGIVKNDLIGGNL